VARLACCGFEWNSLGAASPDFAVLQSGTFPSLAPGGVAFVSAKVRSGFAAVRAQADVNGGAAVSVGGTWSWTASTTYYFRGCYCFAGLPGGAPERRIMVPAPNPSFGPASARVSAAGKLQLWDDTFGSTGVQIGSDWSGTVAADGATWYVVEMSMTLDASGLATTAALQVNGSAVASGGLTNHNAPVGATVVCGWQAADSSNPVMFVDDVAVNDSTGASQNSWCGSGQIVTLFPASDSARGANWTGGAGGTTNLWQAVRNTPPGGLALASATNLTEVVNAVSDSTGNYDAALVPYSAMGVPAAETVLLVMGTWVTACSVTNGVSGAVRLASNPAAAAETAITANTVAATYPTGWVRYPATAAQVASQVVYGDISAANRSVAPVVRIGKRQNSSRVLACCAMGAHVEVTALAQRLVGFNTTAGQAVQFAAVW